MSREEIVARSREAVETALARNIAGLPRPEEIVPDLGFSPTPRELVYTRDLIKLYHYTPVCDEEKEACVVFGDGSTPGPITQRLYQLLLDIQMGNNEELNERYKHWIHVVEP